MLNHIIKKRNKTELVLMRSKVKALLELVFISVFFALWYGALIDDFSSFESIKKEVVEKISEQKALIIFYFAPLIVGFRIWLGISTLVTGNRYIFSLNTQRVSHTQREICRYDQVETIRIRQIHDSDGADQYRLYVVHSNGRKLFIAESTDSSYIRGLASDIADACNSHIEYKN